MDNYKINVIVPVYNASKYIGNTLNSIVSQDFDDFEMIVIDDGSTDNSLKIINETLKDCRIPHKVIHQENAGVSVARNRGIDGADGDYLVFVDADDYISQNHLSSLYNGKTDFSLTLYAKKELDELKSIDTYSKDFQNLQDSFWQKILLRMVKGKDINPSEIRGIGVSDKPRNTEELLYEVVEGRFSIGTA